MSAKPKSNKERIEELEKRVNALARKQAHWEIAVSNYNLSMMDEKIRKMIGIKKNGRKAGIA